MATVSLETVKDWVRVNPFQHMSLKTYYGLETATIKEDPVQSDGWVKQLITPSTPLSVVLMIQDDMYNAIPTTARYSQLRDETTDLQEKATLQLKGRAWPVRRTAEGIAAIGLEEERHSLWTAIGWRALCELRECQIIIVNDALKTVVFYPEDVRLWSNDVPVYIMDSSAHIHFIPPRDFKLKRWLMKQESDGLIVEWPLYDGTMDEIKSLADKLGLAKGNKDALRKKIGYSQSLKHLEGF
jgi:hypothetical protein